MEQNATQIKGGIILNVNMSVKNIIYKKKIMFGILVHVVVKTENIQQVLWMISTIACDEVIASYDDEIKAIPKNFNEKNITCKTSKSCKSFYILLTVI